MLGAINDPPHPPNETKNCRYIVVYDIEEDKRIEIDGRLIRCHKQSRLQSRPQIYKLYDNSPHIFVED